MLRSGNSFIPSSGNSFSLHNLLIAEWFYKQLRVGGKGRLLFWDLKFGVGDITPNLRLQTKLVFHPQLESAYRTILKCCNFLIA